MADFFRSMVSGFGGMLGLIEHKKLEIYAKHGVKTQEHNLKKLMRTNKNTEYGKKCNFKDVKSVKDYQDIVPLSTYDDYADYIDRMVQGEKNLITTWRRVLGQRGQAEIYPAVRPSALELPVLQLQRARRLRRQIFSLKGQKAPAAEGTAHYRDNEPQAPLRQDCQLSLGHSADVS